MKILVFSHQLVMGGTAINAADMAEELRDRYGHEVVLFAAPGPLLDIIREKRLRYRPAPGPRFHPTLGLIRALRSAVREESPDVVHAWDWWQSVDAFYGVHVTDKVPLLLTDMTMEVTRVIPKCLPTTYGTPQLVALARERGRRKAELLLPPVDTRSNAPNRVDSAEFRETHGIGRDEVLVVIVSRLSRFLKGEGLVRAVRAMRKVGRDTLVRLAIVGDGMLRPQLEALARDVNAEAGRPAVLLVGAMLDPRSAYAAADVVVGMGTSALRGMAFGKPVIVVGEDGFSAPFTLETEELFHYQGLYGRGAARAGDDTLVEDLGLLTADTEARRARGELGRRFVEKHFSVEQCGRQLNDLLVRAASETPSRLDSALDAVRTAAVYLRERRFLVPCRDPDHALGWQWARGADATPPRP